MFSVKRAIQNIDAEIWVVDNNSVDGSCAMLKEKFPEVHLIENKDNVGFSKANNQAIRKSNSEYVLLLNPDTIVEDDTFTKVLDFMDKKPEAGGLGVKMIDGKGNFLPESKRALPTPIVSFYKIFGFSSLFPKSKIFSKYHLGYLDKNKIHQIEVLSGAFMLMRKKALDKVGLLDEDFFMYGEDIDLSYRIEKGGYKNYYYPKTTIIHYKGESTKKGSINYVFLFYYAMIIFAKKHFSKKNANIFSFFINMAIYFRAFLSIIKRFVKAIYLPLLDAVSIFLAYFFFIPFYENIKFSITDDFPDIFLFVIVPSYILIWLISIYFAGGYDKPLKLWNVIKGISIGTLIILLAYSLLNEEYRFSRALILTGTVFLYFSGISIRYFLHLLKFSEYRLYTKKRKKVIIVGAAQEAERVKNLMEKVNIDFLFHGYVSPNETINKKKYLGNLKQIREIIYVHKINEVIFCSKDIRSNEIIRQMLYLSDINVNYKIAPQESISIIGSNSIHTAGDLYVLDFNSITKQKNIRIKRLVDIILSFLFLIFFILIIFFIKQKFNFLKNIFFVIFGKYSWVGYKQNNTISENNLPKIRKGILNPMDSYDKKTVSEETKMKINIVYAKNYKITNDLFIIFKAFRRLGRKIIK